MKFQRVCVTSVVAAVTAVSMACSQSPARTTAPTALTDTNELQAREAPAVPPGVSVPPADRQPGPPSPPPSGVWPLPPPVPRGPVPPAPPRPPATGTCDATKGRFAIGERASNDLLERARAAAGASVARFLRPNQPITMEFLASRLNLDLDAHEVVRSVRCG